MSSMQTARGWSPTNCPLHPQCTSLGALHVWLPLMPNVWVPCQGESGASACVACPRPLGTGRTGTQSPARSPGSRSSPEPISAAATAPRFRGRASASLEGRAQAGHSDETPDTTRQGLGLERQEVVGHQRSRVQMTRTKPPHQQAGPAVSEGQTGTCPVVKGLAELRRPLQLQAGRGNTAGGAGP